MSTEKSKGTPLDKFQRQNKILELLAEGKTRLEIQNQLKSEYGVSQATLNNDFLKALQELQRNQESFVTEIKSVIVDRYELLWKEALQKKDLKTAAAVLKQQSALFGLDAPTQITLQDADFEISFS